MGDIDVIMAKLDNILERVNDLESRMVAPKQIAANSLSDITTFLGTVSAGEFRAGVGTPGQGFTGTRIVYPGVVYDGEVWTVCGVNDDKMMVGFRSSDGKFVAGDGEVVIDADGMTAGDGAVVIDAEGIKLYDKIEGQLDEQATIKWIDSLTDLPLGNIGSYNYSNTATFNIYANSNHLVEPGALNGRLELMAISNGTSDDWSTWLFLYAVGDASSNSDVLEMLVGKAGSWSYPLRIKHDFTSRESLVTLACGKAATGDPTGEEGMLYYNKTDNVIKMYADGAWRTLASW